MPELTIVEGQLDDPRVVALVTRHTTNARAVLPDGAGHAFSVDGLKATNIRFWSAWLNGDVVGIGALKTLSTELGEVKSMHTTSAARGQGVADQLLSHIELNARSAGLSQLGLETHPGPYFAPAIALYVKHGFSECPPFGDYVLDPNSMFMTKTLD